ncbi:pyridoxamine 5'-phosphate oxidase family protein [Halorussus litoreus]|uniref:pyridoxamine 5'-phosphate oxidase family protein n=1 Tax=Halorussus litoreus TaxID=1710536 RepID=UPI001E537834|nr:pyridoxamine 5'-phosphate oxidase family protein [Halorussus litoreus]
MTTVKHVDFAYTRGMDDSEIEDRLRTTETGVLSLCSEGDAYAIPLAHYYDGENLYFRIGETEGSEKREFMRSPGDARYVLYGTEATDDPRELDSWSVLVTGRLAELDESGYDRFDTAEINRRFSPIRVFDEDIEDVEITILKFVVDTITGRATPS